MSHVILPNLLSKSLYNIGIKQEILNFAVERFALVLRIIREVRGSNINPEIVYRDRVFVVCSVGSILK